MCVAKVEPLSLFRGFVLFYVFDGLFRAVRQSERQHALPFIVYNLRFTPTLEKFHHNFISTPRQRVEYRSLAIVVSPSGDLIDVATETKQRFNHFQRTSPRREVQRRLPAPLRPGVNQSLDRVGVTLRLTLHVRQQRFDIVTDQKLLWNGHRRSFLRPRDARHDAPPSSRAPADPRRRRKDC